MFPDWVEPKWQQRRGVRKIHVVAVLSALLAAGVVYNLFSEFGIIETNRPGLADRQLVASVDLRIANPAEAFASGEAEARTDIEAGVLKLFTFGKRKPPTPAEAALAQRLKQRHGITWVHKDAEAKPKEAARAAGYNHAVQAELERRHGAEFVERLMRGEDPEAGKAP